MMKNTTDTSAIKIVAFAAGAAGHAVVVRPPSRVVHDAVPVLPSRLPEQRQKRVLEVFEVHVTLNTDDLRVRQYRQLPIFKFLY